MIKDEPSNCQLGIYLWNQSIKKVVYDGRLGTDIPRLMKHWALNTFVDKASLKLLVSYVFLFFEIQR